MPESAQSEVAARPEAAEVPGEEKKTGISLNSSPTGYRGRRRSSATSSTADPSGDQRAASQSTQFSDLDLKEGGLEVKERSPYDDSSNFLAALSGEKAIRKKANELMMTSLFRPGQGKECENKGRSHFDCIKKASSDSSDQ